MQVGDLQPGGRSALPVADLLEHLLGLAGEADALLEAALHHVDHANGEQGLGVKPLVAQLLEDNPGLLSRCDSVGVLLLDQVGEDPHVGRNGLALLVLVLLEDGNCLVHGRHGVHAGLPVHVQDGGDQHHDGQPALVPQLLQELELLLGLQERLVGLVLVCVNVHEHVVCGGLALFVPCVPELGEALLGEQQRLLRVAPHQARVDHGRQGHGLAAGVADLARNPQGLGAELKGHLRLLLHEHGLRSQVQSGDLHLSVADLLEAVQRCLGRLSARVVLVIDKLRSASGKVCTTFTELVADLLVERQRVARCHEGLATLVPDKLHTAGAEQDGGLHLLVVDLLEQGQRTVQRRQRI
mmetsp:Transcript_62149/g.185131  ORF Transcript_62149/g.185131 Transcript_62149/m.185131 type:complete len:354 (-) Transcript_62149:569-1630(-)